MTGGATMNAHTIGQGLAAAVLLLMVALTPRPGFAQASPSAPADPRVEIQAAMEAAGAARQRGPASIDLLDQAVLHLPPGYAFILREPAARLMRAVGNRAGPEFVGLVV